MTTSNRSTYSKPYTAGTGPYHGNWSIPGSTYSGRSPNDSLYMSHESTKVASTRGASRHRSKTSNIEASDSQLAIHSETDTHPKNSGRQAQSQFSAGRKKKASLKQSHYHPYELNNSYDTRPRAVHTSTLSRELNMINQELQNADKTMKLLVDAEDLKLGYLKQNKPPQ